MVLFFIPQISNAQEQLLLMAKEYAKQKDYPKAVELYTTLYTNSPTDKAIVEGYVSCLIGLPDYKKAEKTVKAILKKNKGDLQYTLFLGQVYTAQGEAKKADKLITAAIEDNATSEGAVRNLATLLLENNATDYAIAAYEMGRKKSNNPYLFAEELAALYDKKGDFEKATESLLDLAVQQPMQIENVKTALLRIFTKPDKVEAARKKIINRIGEAPENIVYPDILSWLYIQQNDYESAFTQVKAIDIRLQEQGRRILPFARIAAKEKQFSAAYLAYNYVIEQGATGQYYLPAYAEKISTATAELELMPNYNAANVDSVLKTYEAFFAINPNAQYTETQKDYAMLLARYANQPKKAIEALQKITTVASGSNVLRGHCKLDLGDYYLIDNNNWEATLLYSQVDKEFKNDMLGEEARYKNAVLSYYIGDFDWAQGQLDVLKASTSELIANDALQLSVLITENSALDSLKTPLEIFSRAQLLLFQNKNELATKTLDSITNQFPEHALLDDILMTKAQMEKKQHHYTKALEYLMQIYTIHKEDILADDAIYQSAVIQDKFLNNVEEAKKLYEKIILEYPGSSFITDSRKEYRRLRGDVLN